MSMSESLESEALVEKLISQYDDTSMPLPDMESEPQLLISKVRKHYMEYLIKLLSENYETNQQLLNKNIYLPSAIWRCAKEIEMTAAQTCMVVQLYRRNIITIVKQVIHDTKKKKLNRKLYECLHTPPINEKRTQTTLSVPQECNCECSCKRKKKKSRKSSQSPNATQNSSQSATVLEVNKIPVLINSQIEKSQNNNTIVIPTDSNQSSSITQSNSLPSSSVRMSIESQESDELMLQLEKLFQSDPNDPNDDDLFDLCFAEPTSNFDCGKKLHTENAKSCDPGAPMQVDNSIIESHAHQIKSLDERLESLAGMLANSVNSTAKPEPNEQNVPEETPKTRRPNSSKWLCEEHFLKSRLFELLDEIGDRSRRRLAQLKVLMTELFGEDSDNEGVMSPLEETPEFIISCKERIAPWVVKLLTPHYIRGHIRGKALFKSLAKHLIRLICQCSRYPQEYEVRSFVSDFMKTHKLIRCEADFKQFRIENI